MRESAWVPVCVLCVRVSGLVVGFLVNNAWSVRGLGCVCVPVCQCVCVIMDLLRLEVQLEATCPSPAFVGDDFRQLLHSFLL